jgi:hypothetical protein
VAQIYPQAQGSILIVSYNSQGYDGGIWPRPNMGNWLSILTVLVITSRHDHIENAILLLLRAYSLLREHVYWAVAQKWPLFIHLSHGHCIKTAVHATI